MYFTRVCKRRKNYHRRITLVSIGITPYWIIARKKISPVTFFSKGLTRKTHGTWMSKKGPRPKFEISISWAEKERRKYVEEAISGSKQPRIQVRPTSKTKSSSETRANWRQSGKIDFQDAPLRRAERLPGIVFDGPDFSSRVVRFKYLKSNFVLWCLWTPMVWKKLTRKRKMTSK